MRVIYIAGAAHSGSTLLDLMLNAHPEIVSVGEILKLNRPVKSRSPDKVRPLDCSCGAISLQQCAFWSRVDEQVMEMEGKSLAELAVEDYGRPNGHAAPNAVLFKAIADVSGKSFVVDSSKIPRRLGHLMTLDELDVYPVHLVRDPKGQIASVIDNLSLGNAILRYDVVHAQIRGKLKSVPHSVVRYEDLVLEPENTLQTVLKPLGLAFHPRQLEWAEQVSHSFAGNHVRRRTKSVLVLDERWKQRLRPAQQLAIDIGTLPSRRLTTRIGHQQRLDQVRWLAHTMDERYGIPGTRIRFGWDAIIGLLPGFGDALAGAIGLVIVHHAWQTRAPAKTLARMLGNLAVDLVLGIVPLVGDILDIAWKGNRRNALLFEQHLNCAG
jgi:hypothetical protein